MMSSTRVLPQDSRNGFPGVCIVGSLGEDVQKWRQNGTCDANLQQIDLDHLELSVAQPPIIMCQKDVQEKISNARYDLLKPLKKQMADDLREIDDKVKSKGIHAFDTVDTNYYLAHSSTGSTWIYNYHKTEKDSPTDDSDLCDTKYIKYYYQVGKYSANAQIAGTVEFIFESTKDLETPMLAALIGKMMQIILQKGTKLVLDNLVDELMAFASEYGLEATLDIVENGASYLIQAIIFVLAFVGLDERFDWESRKYAVKLSLYNWTSDHTLYVFDCYLDNAKMMCNEQDMINCCETHIPPMISPGKEITPPGFRPADDLKLEVVCHYVTYFFENDASFLKGLGLALRVEIDERGSNKGFIYAFKCPRFKNNRHKIGKNLCNYDTSKEYYDKGEWSANPLDFPCYNVQGGSLRVSMDALNGNDGYYRPIINYLGVRL